MLLFEGAQHRQQHQINQPPLRLSPFSLYHISPDLAADFHSHICPLFPGDRNPMFLLKHPVSSMNFEDFPVKGSMFAILIALIITRLALLGFCEGVFYLYPDRRSLNFLPSLLHSLRLWFSWLNWPLYLGIFATLGCLIQSRRISYSQIFFSSKPSCYETRRIPFFVPWVALGLWLVGFLLWWTFEAYIVPWFIDLLIKPVWIFLGPSV